MRDDPSRTTPLGMIRYSHDFLKAAKIVDENIGNQPGFEVVAPIPALYLVGHSIELSLKSFLLHKGISLRELRSRYYGHNLDACLEKGKRLGLLTYVQFTDQEYRAFEALNTLYSAKQLEYIVTGEKHFPIFGLIELFAVKLCKVVSYIVGFGEQLTEYPTLIKLK
jgi:hypothetical protein